MTEEKEGLRSLTRPKSLSPEQQEYQELVYKTLRRLIINLQQGGFCLEPSENRRYYWVALRGLQKQYGIIADVIFEKGLPKQADVGAGDLNVPIEGKRSFQFGVSYWDPTVSLSDPAWEGAIGFSMERIREWAKNERLSRKEQKSFLNELLSAQIDEEETRKEFEKSKRESPNWRHYWAKERLFLALP